MIDIRPQPDAGATVFRLVLHNLNTKEELPATTVQVVQNWNIYRKYRPDELFMQNHHVYNVTRPHADLKPFGDAGLDVLIPLLDGPLTNKQAAEASGHSYHVCARIFRLAADHGIADVDIGPRNCKTYTLKPEWEAILQENRPRTTTYGVELQRSRRSLKSRIAYCHKRAPGKVPALREEQKRLDALWRKVVERAGIVPFKPPKQVVLKRDPAAEAEKQDALYRPLWDQWIDLAPMPEQERRRVLHFADWSNDDIDAMKLWARQRYRTQPDFIMPPATPPSIQPWPNTK